MTDSPTNPKDSAKKPRSRPVIDRMRMAEARLRDQIGKARESSDFILNTVREVSATSTRAMEKAESCFAGTRSLEESVQKVSRRSEMSAKRMEEVKGILRKTASEIKSLVDAVNGSLGENVQILEKAKALSGLTGEIDHKVGGVVATSEQITLLALNAVIAANRAGRYGRAFSVVANQIQILAERSTESAEEIGTLASAIQGEVRGVLESIESIHGNSSDQIEKSKKLEEDLRKTEKEATGIQDGCRRLEGQIDRTLPVSDSVRRTTERIVGSGEELSRRVRQGLAALETQRECFETIQFSVEALDDAVRTLDAADGPVEGLDEQIHFALNGVSDMIAGVQESARNAVAGVHEITELATREVEQIRQNTQNPDVAQQPIEAMRQESKELHGKAAKLQDHMESNILSGLKRLVGAMDQAARGIAVALEKIQGLRTKTRRIQKIAWEISTIIQETNLMAFNGSVEAVRAGQFGRSFAQVANDVRDLARESIDASDRIQFLVHEIEDQLFSMIRILENLGEKARRIAEQSSTTMQHLKLIQHNFQGFQEEVGGLDEVVNELESSISNATRGVESMLSSIDAMAKAATSARAEARDRVQAIELLESRLADLRALEQEVTAGAGKDHEG